MPSPRWQKNNNNDKFPWNRIRGSSFSHPTIVAGAWRVARAWCARREGTRDPGVGTREPSWRAHGVWLVHGVHDERGRETQVRVAPSHTMWDEYERLRKQKMKSAPFFDAKLVVNTVI